MRRYLALALSAYVSASAIPAQPAASATPRLVLVLAIDQMRFDYLTRFEPLYKGGLRTLMDRGAVFTDAKYRHAASETGPGHSVLLSGRHPSHSGIVANEWYDPYLRRSINVVADPAQVPLGGAGRAASPANAIGFTIGDVLKVRSPESRIVGVSLKDRSAILMGGLRADAAYWFENTGGNFITSSFYMDAAPSWLIDWNARRLADTFAGRAWTRMIDDVALYEKYAGPDAITGERDGKDTTFPHVFTAEPPQVQHFVEFRRTPFADELTLAFTLEVMKQHELGKDANTDILAIGFSATDSIGHAYGPDSQETMDQLLRLDRLLAQLFSEIESTVGLNNTIVILSSDHGARPLVEFEHSRGANAPRRVAPTVLTKAVNEAFATRFPGVTDLVSYFSIDFYLNEDVMRRHKLNRKEVEQVAVDALLKTGVVERVYTPDDLKSTGPSSDPFLPLFQNAYYEPRSPHLNVLLKREVYLTAAVGGSGHGSAYDFDLHVPVVFMGRGITPGRYADSSGPEDIAPTLAHMLQLEFPREQDSRLLLEMLSPVRASDR
jgi:predicted AlkP superfamily pyrophosphatase or phosphodiesterase